MQKSGITKNMADFEKVFEDLDVTSAVMTGAMDNVVADTGDQDAVKDLLTQMQAEMGLSAQG